MPVETAVALLQPALDGLRAAVQQIQAQVAIVQAQYDLVRAQADLDAQKAEAATLPAGPLQPTRGERFYVAYRTAKGGRTKTGAVMALWAEIGPAFKMAWVAAAETAATGKGGAESYAAYLAARSPAAVDGPATPWETLPDQNAWTTAAEALRGA
jgi:hypothetical protein